MAGAICLSPEGRAPTLTLGVTGPLLHDGNHGSYCTGLKPPKTAMLIFNTVKTSYLFETKSIYFGQNCTHYIILFNFELVSSYGMISSFFSRAKEYWAVLNQLSLQEN